jgi:hypothetical protein
MKYFISSFHFSILVNISTLPRIRSLSLKSSPKTPVPKAFGKIKNKFQEWLGEQGNLSVAQAKIGDAGIGATLGHIFENPLVKAEAIHNSLDAIPSLIRHTFEKYRNIFSDHTQQNIDHIITTTILGLVIYTYADLTLIEVNSVEKILENTSSQQFSHISLGISAAISSVVNIFGMHAGKVSKDIKEELRGDLMVSLSLLASSGVLLSQSFLESLGIPREVFAFGLPMVFLYLIKTRLQKLLPEFLESIGEFLQSLSSQPVPEKSTNREEETGEQWEKMEFDSSLKHLATMKDSSCTNPIKDPSSKDEKNGFQSKSDFFFQKGKTFLRRSVSWGGKTLEKTAKVLDTEVLLFPSNNRK